MADPEHSEKLNEGAVAWNAWRDANPEITPDLSMVNLSLNRRQFGPSNGGPINFSHTNLEATMLRFATLTGANLESACFAGSDLMHARLERTNLTSADLRGALLDNSDFTGSTLDSALLYGASLLNVRNLLQHQIDQAYGDETTLLPEGLVMPQHWLVAEEPELLDDVVEDVTAAEADTLADSQSEVVIADKEPHPEPAIQSEAREVRDAIEKVLAELKSEEVAAETDKVATPTENAAATVATALTSTEVKPEPVKIDPQALASIQQTLQLGKIDSYSPPPIPLKIKRRETDAADKPGALEEANTKPADAKAGPELTAASVTVAPAVTVQSRLLDEPVVTTPENAEPKIENVIEDYAARSSFELASLNDDQPESAPEIVSTEPDVTQTAASQYAPQIITADRGTEPRTKDTGEDDCLGEMVFRPEKYGTLIIPLNDQSDRMGTSEEDVRSDFLKEYVPQRATYQEEPKPVTAEALQDYLSRDYTTLSTSQPELAPYSPPRSTSKYDEPKPPFEIGNVYYEAAPKKKDRHLGMVALLAAVLVSGGAYYWLGTSDAEPPKQAAAVDENRQNPTPTPVVAPEQPPTQPAPVVETAAPLQAPSNAETTSPAAISQPEQPAVVAEQSAPPVVETPNTTEPAKENVAALEPPPTPAIEQTTQNAQNVSPPPVVEQPIVTPPQVPTQQTQVLAANNPPVTPEVTPSSERPAANTPRAKAAAKEWKRLSRSKDLTALYRFIKKYPNEASSDEARTKFSSVVSETPAPKLAKFVKKNATQDNDEISAAKQRLAELQPEAPAATPAAPARPAAPPQVPDESGNPDDVAWSKATTKNTRAAYDAYLRAHPEGPHAAEAKTKIASLRDSYRQNDAAAWEKAKKAGTAEAFAAYLASNPRGYHVKDAQRAMNEVREEEPRPPRSRRESRRQSREVRHAREARERAESPRHQRSRQALPDHPPEDAGEPPPID